MPCIWLIYKKGNTDYNNYHFILFFFLFLTFINNDEIGDNNDEIGEFPYFLLYADMSDLMLNLCVCHDNVTVESINSVSYCNKSYKFYKPA